MYNSKNKCSYIKYNLAINHSNDLMNPMSKSSPFYSTNNLKVNTIYTNDCFKKKTENFYTYNNPSCDDFDSFNNLNPLYNTDTSHEYLGQVGHSSTYDINDEFYYNYSYNRYEEQNYGYQVDKSTLYDNCSSSSYDIYENNTFCDSRPDYY